MFWYGSSLVIHSDPDRSCDNKVRSCLLDVHAVTLLYNSKGSGRIRKLFRNFSRGDRNAHHHDPRPASRKLTIGGRSSSGASYAEGFAILARGFLSSPPNGVCGGTRRCLLILERMRTRTCSEA